MRGQTTAPTDSADHGTLSGPSAALLFERDHTVHASKNSIHINDCQRHIWRPRHGAPVTATRRG